MNEIRNFIDTLFAPVLSWLASISAYLRDLIVPVARPLDFGKYFGWFNILGDRWVLFVTTACSLTFIYFLVYIIVNSGGLYQKFKDWVKWW